MKGIAAGAGAAALAPLAVKNAGRLIKALGLDGLDDLVHAPQGALQNATGKLGDHVGSGIGDKVSEKVDDAGGPSGILKDTVKDALPFGGGGGRGGGGGKGGVPGVGKGRRMPVQQEIDIGLPLETVYNQWAQFEVWPNFMHRVTRVTQEDPCTVSFAVKIWGKTKEFTA
ncbi:MAG TPA: SRPBCC family protein, partial [Solirubrobacteraceae bacterium]|nr:SRPBCC family protein [Solirubrobacteraceae bacterium]